MRRLALLALVLAFGAVSNSLAATREFAVTGWGAGWTGFADDFADGTFPDGDGGELRLYVPTCGSVDDSHEASGRLRLTGPNAPCGGVAVTPIVQLTASTLVRARFHPVIAPLESFFGVSLAHPDLEDRLDVMIERGPFFGAGSDAIGVALVSEDAVVERLVISSQAAVLLATPTSIEVELELTPTQDRHASVPHLRVRTCPIEGCAPQAPFADLPDVAPRGSGTMAADRSYRIDFFAFAEQSFTIDLLDWSARIDFFDEFSGSFGDRVAYDPRCAEFSVANGSLIATVTDAGAPCGNSGLFAIATLPGEATAQATYEWRWVPEACSDGFGLGLIASNQTLLGADGAFMIVRRGPIPGIGADVLYVSLEPESLDGGRPLSEIFVLSTAPTSFPLAGSIELRIVMQSDGTALVPHGQVRTCPGNADSCEGAASFQDLIAFSFPQDDPDLVVCGRRAAEFAASLDTSVANPQTPLQPVLVLAPEPGAELIGLAASIALAARSILLRRLPANHPS